MRIAVVGFVVMPFDNLTRVWYNMVGTKDGEGNMNNHTSVKVASLPRCDFRSDEANYDGKTVYGPWANMCQSHFEECGMGLRLGRGQRLLVGRGRV